MNNERYQYRKVRANESTVGVQTDEHILWLTEEDLIALLRGQRVGYFHRGHHNATRIEIRSDFVTPERISDEELLMLRRKAEKYDKIKKGLED